MSAPFPDKKSAPGLSAPAQALAEHEDIATLDNQKQDLARAGRLLVVALGLIGEALDSAWHGDAEDVELHAIRAAQIATHQAIEFMQEEGVSHE